MPVTERSHNNDDFVRYRIGRGGLALVIDGPAMPEGHVAEVRLLGTVRIGRGVDDDGCEYETREFEVADWLGPRPPATPEPADERRTEQP
jgi:hypothetical protein